MTGMSPLAPEQPTPLRWVRLRPRIRVAVYWYPPGAGVEIWVPREVCGLQASIPNGVTAPG